MKVLHEWRDKHGHYHRVLENGKWEWRLGVEGHGWKTDNLLVPGGVTLEFSRLIKDIKSAVRLIEELPTFTYWSDSDGQLAQELIDRYHVEEDEC